jgi:hypothetical protein
MSRTKRLRSAVHEYLDEQGEANTSQIYEHINNRFRWGATMSQLGNILARDVRFKKSGFDNSRFGDGIRTRVCVWQLAAC